MKISQIAFIASTIASAFAESVAKAYNLKLYAEYFDKDGYVPVNGKFVQAVKVDPDTYLFVLGEEDEAATIQFDFYENVAYIKDDQGTFYVYVDDTLGLVASSNYYSNQYFTLFTSNSDKTLFNYVTVNTDHSFVPTKDVGDPINYSKDHYALLVNADDDSEGANLHYEFVGTNTGNGTGILNPSSFTDAIESTRVDITLATEFYTGVSTTNPPTAAPTGTETVDVNDEHEFGHPDGTDADAGAPTADDSNYNGSNSATETESGSESGSSQASKTFGGSSHASATASDASSSKSESASSKSTPDSGSAEAKPSSSSSSSSAPSSSASSSTNNGNGKLVAGGVGLIALLAAAL